jgi:hypothetical protein
MKTVTFPHFLISTFNAWFLHSPSFDNMLYSNSWQLYLLSPSILFLFLFYSSPFICSFFLPEGHTRYEHGRPASVNSASFQDGFRQASQYQRRTVHSLDGDMLSRHTYITGDIFRSVFYRQQSYCIIVNFNYISKHFVIIYELKSYSSERSYNLPLIRLTTSYSNSLPILF